MPYKPVNRPTEPCSNPNCDNRVQPRRHSATGTHWCREKPCQAMRQRQYAAIRKIRREAELEAARQSGTGEVASKIRHALMAAVMAGVRVSCTGCGSPEVLPGFLHRAGVGSTEPCYGVGSLGREIEGTLLDLAMPHLLTPERLAQQQAEYAHPEQAVVGAAE